MAEYSHRTGQRGTKVSRRGVIRGSGIIAAGVAAAALVGCSSRGTQVAPAAPPASGAAAPVVRTGTIRLSTTKMTESFDPARMVSAGPQHWGLWANSALYINKQNYKIEPSLIESWESKSPTEISLKVRRNVAFHDKAPTNGRLLKAEDIAYSLNRHAGLLDSANAGLYPRRTNFRGMTKAEAVDDSTVVLRMSTPNALIINGIADTRCPIMAVETKDSDFVEPSKLVGTGPWIVKQIDENGAGTLVANPKYWEAGLPKAAEITRPYYETVTAGVAAFLADAHDQVALINLPWSYVQTIAEKRPDAKQLRWPYGYMHNALFNYKKGPFTDQRVRKAMQLVIDVKPIGDGYYGPLWEYTGPIASTWTEAIPSAEIKMRPGWNAATKEQDIAEAKKLMAAAGFPEGEVDLIFLVRDTPVHPANSERARAQWNRVWPKMKIKLDGPLQTAPFYARTNAGGFDIMGNGNFPASDATNELQLGFASDSPRNYAKFSDPEVDKITIQALAEFDPAVRARLIRQAEEIVINKVAGVYYYTANQVAFVTPKWSGIDGYPGPAGLGGNNDLPQGTKLVSIVG